MKMPFNHFFHRKQFLAKPAEEQEAILKEMLEERRTKHFDFEDIIDLAKEGEEKADPAERKKLLRA